MPIVVEGVTYTYSPRTPFESVALRDVSFCVQDGQTVGIIGTTGSGKSTLIQHFNGLIRLQTGKILVGEQDLSVRRPDLKKLRARVGMLFQYPEYQLFADTVEKDVSFGPLNFGFDKQAAAEAARQAIARVGLDWEEVGQKSPFELSGGQKRRVALAGVIACNPEILVLDEPTAGLDPLGKREILDLIRDMRQAGSVRIVVMISHNMDEIAAYCDQVVVLQQGRVIASGAPRDLFASFDATPTGLELPHTVAIQRALEGRGMTFSKLCLTPEELADELRAQGVGQ